MPGHYVKEIKLKYVQKDFCKQPVGDKQPCLAPAVGTAFPQLKFLHHSRDLQTSLPPGVR